jgi:O-antigen ligase
MVAMLLLGGFLAGLRGRLVAAGIFLAVLLGGGAGMVALIGVGSGAGASYVLDPLAAVSGTADFGSADDPTSALTDALTLAGRAAAAEAAALTWLDHPLFGVSLGNNYRYFSLYAPDWAFATQLFQGAKEGVGWLDPNSPEKGNAKNLFLRLLSETGLVGFALFALFFLRQIFQGPPRDSFHRYFRLITAVALGFSFFNQDSFVDAGLWIPLVLCFAMNRGNREEAATV